MTHRRANVGCLQRVASLATHRIEIHRVQGNSHMADHSSGNASKDMEAHRSAYEGFITGAVALSIICGFVLVALVDFRFNPGHNVFVGFAGIILGVIAVLIDARTGAKWFLSAGLLVLFGLISAFSVS